MKLTVPDPSLVLLVGPSGAGKSTFARRNFRPTEILSSDDLRAVVADDQNDQGASAEAFQALGLLLNARIRRRLLTVVDATNLRTPTRRRWLGIARRYGVPAVAVVFDLPLATFRQWNQARPGRRVEGDVLEDQIDRLAAVLPHLSEEGFERVYLLSEPAALAALRVEREARRS